MGIGKTLKRIGSYGFKRKNVKNIRKKLGMTGDSKWARQLKRSLRGRAVASPVSTSAVTEGYRYQPRPISSLM